MKHTQIVERLPDYLRASYYRAVDAPQGDAGELLRAAMKRLLAELAVDEWSVGALEDLAAAAGTASVQSYRVNLVDRILKVALVLHEDGYLGDELDNELLDLAL